MQMFNRGLFAPKGAAEEGDSGRWEDGAQMGQTDDLTPDDHAASLLKTIEAEIIPRLMLAHRGPSNDDRGPADSLPRATAEPHREAAADPLREFGPEHQGDPAGFGLRAGVGGSAERRGDRGGERGEAHAAECRTDVSLWVSRGRAPGI